ncbi:MAG: VOC family protein [Pseudomonadota bacterium]
MLGDNWELNHVGLIVTNRNAVLRHLQALGVGVSVGPQPLLPHEDGEGSLTYYRTLVGEPVTSTYKTGGAHTFNDGESQIGDCQLECIQMRPGPGSFFTEYLDRQGPGINHICFNSPTVEADTEWLRGKDCDLVFNALVNGKTVENYLDTRTHGDMMVSLRPPPTDWERAWKANNEAHPLVTDWRFLGPGIGVRDLDATLDYYAALGFAPEGELRLDARLGTRSGSMRVGPLRFEFVEASGADSPYSASLATRGEGVNDLAFGVADIAAAGERLASRGAALLYEANDGSAAYFDTRAEGNIMIRLVQLAAA